MCLALFSVLKRGGSCKSYATGLIAVRGQRRGRLALSANESRSERKLNTHLLTNP